MAFASASGYNNLPNGNFSPVIYSQKVQKAFRKNSVVEDVTNTDYMGEIANYGDSVKIIKEPDITINKLERGTSVAKQDLSDADFSLIIDQAQYFMFSIDDIEKINQDNYGKRSIEAEKAMNIIALEAKLALNSLSLKTSKDRMNLQLEEFLRSLSDKEIEQFRLLKNYSSLVQSIKTMDLRDDKFNNFADIKNLDDHIIESMIKRFFDA